MRHVFAICALALVGACGESSDPVGAADGSAAGDGSDTGDGSDAGASASTFTYHRDARPIVEAKCLSCHQPGNIAPYPFTSYAEVFALRGAIAASVESGAMPPWQPATGCNSYLHDFSLTEVERSTLLGWVNGGAVEGDPGDYRQVTVEGEQFRADLALEMAEPYAPNSRPDDYRCFLIDWPEAAEKFVTGFRVTPGRLDMVHHVLAYVATPDQVAELRAMDDAEEGPGYTCFGSPGQTSSGRPYQIGAWVPGMAGRAFPDGTGIKVDPGSVVVVQMHYNTLTSEPASDQSKIEVTLADQVERPAITFLATDVRWLRAGGMVLPKGQKEVVHSADLDITKLFPYLGGDRVGLGVGDPFVIHGVGFHMHQLGVHGRVSVLRGGTQEECLLDIPDWDFNWQGSYQLKSEVRVAPGDLIRLSCTWDNSAENQPFVNGAQLEARDVEWGEGTSDEMCLSGLFVTAN